MILAVDKKKLKKSGFDWNLSPDLCNTSSRKAWSLAGFISLMGRALWLVSQRSGFDSWKSPGFCRFFFNRLGCLFNCEDYFHFHIFIRNSKYESFHWIISIHVNLVGNLRKGVFERLTSTLSESYLAATKLSLLLQRRFAQKFG